MIKIHTKKLSETTAGFCDIIDITAKVQEQIEQEKIDRGVVTLFVSGSTAALTTVEYEPGLVRDLKEFVEQLIPSTGDTTTMIVGATTTVFRTCVLLFLVRHWRFPLRKATRCSARGSKSSCWTSTIARAQEKSSFN